MRKNQRAKKEQTVKFSVKLNIEICETARLQEKIFPLLYITQSCVLAWRKKAAAERKEADVVDWGGGRPGADTLPVRVPLSRVYVLLMRKLHQFVRFADNIHHPDQLCARHPLRPLPNWKSHQCSQCHALFRSKKNKETGQRDMNSLLHQWVVRVLLFTTRKSVHAQDCGCQRQHIRREH